MGYMDKGCSKYGNIPTLKTDTTSHVAAVEINMTQDYAQLGRLCPDQSALRWCNVVGGLSSLHSTSL